MHMSQVTHQARAYHAGMWLLIYTPPGWDGSPTQGYPQERGLDRVHCLAQKHNIITSSKARTRPAQSGFECTNHKAIAPL